MPNSGAAGSHSRRPPVLALSHALVLGGVQGPAEVLPISSSGHMAVLPWFLGWDYGELEPELRKAFEVALHAAGGLALAFILRAELGELLQAPALAAVSQAPAAVAGYALERPIEARLGTPATVAAGLIAGGLAMAWADRRPQSRRAADAGLRDALWLGLAQACALFPGVSRGGATLTAARLLRFRRHDAHRLSRRMALPVIAGAAVLKAVRLRAYPVPAPARLPFAAGAAASFGSTLAAGRLLRRGERTLVPFAVYRMALGTAILLRLRSARSTTMSG